MNPLACIWVFSSIESTTAPPAARDRARIAAGTCSEPRVPVEQFHPPNQHQDQSHQRKAIGITRH